MQLKSEQTSQNACQHKKSDTTQNDEHLQTLTAYIINSWSLTKAEVRTIQPYWTFP